MKPIVVCLALLIFVLFPGAPSIQAQTVPVSVLEPTLQSGTSDYFTFNDRDDFPWGGFRLNVDPSFLGDGNDLALATLGKRDLTLTALGGNIVLFPTGKGRVGVGTTSPGARFHLTATNMNGLISSVTNSGDWSYGILSRVNRKNTKAFAAINTQTGIENFTVFGSGEIVSSMGWGNWMRFEDQIGGNAYVFHNPQGGDRFEIGVRHGGQYRWGVFTIRETGEVGIGTNSPAHRLSVAGTVEVAGHDLLLGTNDGRDKGQLHRQRALVHGGVGVGAKFEDSLILNYGGDFEGGVEIHGPRLIVGRKHQANSAHEDYRLAVDGKIVAKEVIVTVQGWADSVFREDYELRSLDTVREFIETSGHLPDVPSEAQVLEEGVSVGEMDAVLLRKIEELTLYLLEMEQTSSKLRERLERLEVSQNLSAEHEESGHGDA